VVLSFIFYFQTFDEVGKSEYGQKGKQFVDELGKTVGKTAQTVRETTENLSQTQVYQTASQVGFQQTLKDHRCKYMNCFRV
jgi:hypothetical protein